MKHLDLVPSRRHLTLPLDLRVQLFGELGEHIAQIGVLPRQLLTIRQVSIGCHSALDTLGKRRIYVRLGDTRPFLLLAPLRLASHFLSAPDRLEALSDVQSICDFSQSEPFDLSDCLAENFRKFVLFRQIAEL